MNYNLAVKKKQHQFVTNSSNYLVAVLNILIKKRLIYKYETFKNKSNLHKIKIYIKYSKKGAPLIENIDINLRRRLNTTKSSYEVSSFIYKSSLKTFYIFTTPYGFLTKEEVMKKKIGGTLFMTLNIL